MKGFIEVHEDNHPSMLNVNFITHFGDRWILYVGREYEIRVNETYDELKNLINNALQEYLV